MSAQQVNDNNFQEEVLNSNIPVLVDYWAPWCGPCRMVGPTIDKMAGEFAGKFKIVKLNVDDNRVTAQQHNINSIPTMMIFVNGKVVDTIVGAQPEGNIRTKLNEHV